MTERPLGEVLARDWDDFVPERPNGPPWHQPRAVVDEVAYSGDLVTVPLRIADRVTLRRLGGASHQQEWQHGEPTDCMPVG